MELELVEWLRSRLPASRRLIEGVGDDGAVIAWTAREGAGQLVVTVDAITDQVDFRLGETDPVAIGHKALGVNLSDLAAMAAEPVAAVVSLILPREGGGGLSALDLAKGIFEGMIPLAEKFGVALAGGDTNLWDGPLAISITAMGRTTSAGPLTRSGASPGDWVLVTGSLGGSILGRHLAVEPRIDEALALHRQYGLTAGIDVSDGLALDASRLGSASGCGVALRLEEIPVSADAAQLAATSGRAPLDHALADGEDFELVVTAKPADAERILRDQPIDVPVTCIGKCVLEAGLWQVDAAGALAPLEPRGFVHS